MAFSAAPGPIPGPFGFVDGLDRVPQIRLTDDVVSAKYAIGDPATKLHNRPLPDAHAVHFPRKATPQVMERAQRFEDFHFRRAIGIELLATTNPDRFDDARQAGFIA